MMSITDDSTSDPPEVDVPLLKNKDLPKNSVDWQRVQLPIDFLLLTGTDCAFLACLSYLNRGFFRSHHGTLGLVYFGDIGGGEMRQKIAVIKCSIQGPVIVVPNAVKILGPKAVFSVGFCSGLDEENLRLGDVVVSEKLITYAPSKVTEDGSIVNCGISVPLKKRLAKLVQNANDGWEAPLIDPGKLEVEVHRNGVFLSGPEEVDNKKRRDQLIKRFPQAIAIELEGEGLFAAAHELDVEWIVIKGVSDFADGKKHKTVSWRRFASIMAASLTAHILSDTLVFKDWPHFGGFTVGHQSSKGVYSQLTLPAGFRTHRRSGFKGNPRLPPLPASKTNSTSGTKGFSGRGQASGYSRHPFPVAYQKQTRSGIQGFPVRHQSSKGGYSQLTLPAGSRTHRKSGFKGHLKLPPLPASQTHSTSGTEGFSGGCQSSVAGCSQPRFPAAPQTHGSSGIKSPGLTFVVNFLKDTYKKRSLLKPLLWEDTLKLPIEDVYTRLKILSRRITDFQLGSDEVDMYDIFVTPDDVTVLVEGSPGIGKTTFCLKIAYDWANGKIPEGHSFPKFEIVLLLKCRDIDGDVLDAINEQLLPENKKLRKELMGYISELHHHGKVLLILDGLDELPKKLKPNVDKLLHRKILPFCNVLATSRQERGIQIRQKVDFDVLLQIEGFTNADAFVYIIKHFNRLGPEQLSKGERLIKAIQENSFLHALPNNPLNLLLLCVVFEDYEGELPSRRTELYQIIVRCILRRFCAKNNLGVPKDDEALEKTFEQSLLALGELAWKCLLKNRLSFREGELAKFEEMYKDLAARISGLVFKEASLKKINPQHEYHFFHKTFVEYLAAAYLAFLLLNKEVSIFRELQLDFHWHIVVKYRQVFLFLSGILGEKASILFRQIGKKLKSKNWDWLKCQKKEAEFFTESFSESGNAKEVAMALFSFIPFPLTVEVGRHNDFSSSSFFEVAKYCRSFSQLQHPVHLSVYCGDVEDIEVISAFDYLKSCPKPQSLFVSSLQALGNAFYDGLSQNSTLMSVTLRTLQSLPRDMNIIGDSLAASNTLTSVTFQLFHEWGDAWARALEKGLSADTPLSSVVLEIYGSLSQTAIHALKRVLVNTFLTSVVITIFGEMPDSLAAALCEGLSEQAFLKSFTLVVFGRVSVSDIGYLRRGFLQNYSLNTWEVKIFGELPDSSANVVNGIFSASNAKQSCTFHPNTSGSIAAVKVACLTPVLAKRGFNLEQTLNFWGEFSSEIVEAVGRLLVKSTPYRLTLNIYGNVFDDVASSLMSYLKIENCVHLVTFNIWGELTTNGKAAIERFSGANHNANLKVIVHDLLSDCSPCGLHLCVDDPSLLPSVFSKVKDTGTSELSLTISAAVSDDWVQGLNDGLTNNTSLKTLALSMENYHYENVRWMQRLLEVVLENTSLTTLTLTLTLYSLTNKRIDLSKSLAKNASLTALSLTINSYISNSCFRWSGLRDGLTSNKSLRTLALAINNYRGTGRVWIEDLGDGLALNKSLHTLTLTISNYSDTGGDLIPGLGDGLASNKSLHTLTLTINNYSGTGGDLIPGLGHGLASNKSLHTLTLTINNYSDTGGDLIRGLGDGLASNKSLHTLTLTINNYSGTSEVFIHDLVHGLVSNKSLHTLTLTINNYKGTGGVRIRDLVHGLASNKSLRTLILTVNIYNDAAGIFIMDLCDGFARNESALTFVSLTISSCSEVNKDQLLELCNNLAKIDTLTTLSLTINDHSSTRRGLGCDLSKCFAACKSLTSLSLAVSLYGEEDVC